MSVAFELPKTKSLKPPRISVVLSAYNGSKYIREQLASILSQLGNSDEVIVVDDASQDDTVYMVEQFADLRIRLLLNPCNIGIVRSFEKGLQQASGEFIFLSDQDDIWIENKVRTVLDTFSQDPELTLVLSNASLIDADGRDLGRSFQAADRFRGGPLSTLLKNRYHGCTMAFRRAVSDAALPFPENIPMHDSWIGLVNTFVGKAKFLDSNLVRYRRHGDAVTATRLLNMGQRVQSRWTLAINFLRRIHVLRRQDRIRRGQRQHKKLRD